MDARTLNIKAIFGQDRRHEIPLYQRPYVWTRTEQWEPLWDDIRLLAEQIEEGKTPRAHFLGAIVLDQMRIPTGSVEKRQVIDGQQRLTTIQLFLEAFCDVCRGLEQEKFQKALEKLTRNDDPMSNDPDEVFKVWPTNLDRDRFRTVMTAEAPGQVLKAFGSNGKETGHSIADAYLYFAGVIKSWLSEHQETRAEALLRAVREFVRMVVIDLQDDDDPQLIFETLNARGTPLLPSDLVKNFLFHRASKRGVSADALYQKYWEPFDSNASYWRKELGRGHARRARIDQFFQHFLTLKTREEIKVGHLYAGFQDYFEGPHGADPTGLLKDLKGYAEIYETFDAHPDPVPREFFAHLAAMDITTAYPFLLELLARLGTSSGALFTILIDLESFLVRRMVCHLNTRGYNRLFLDLTGLLADQPPVSLERSIRELLLSSSAESGRWPDDNEFKTAWLETPIYATLVRARVRMLLEALEGALRSEMTEKVQIGEKLTIEHLMPQEWRAHWPLAGGGEDESGSRERLLHTIGNLTLLNKKLNPSISNGPWDAKCKAIAKHAVLRMNIDLMGEDAWDEDRIRYRGTVLFKEALKLWPYPKR